MQPADRTFYFPDIAQKKFVLTGKNINLNIFSLLMMKNYSDKELLTAEDFQSAFAILYNRYWQRLYSKAQIKLRNDADSQDAVQEVFVSLWRNRQTIEIDGTLESYLFSALKYCIIKKIYRNARKGEYLPLSHTSAADYSAAENDPCNYKELESVILKELDSLPTKMRHIYDLSRVEHLRTAEIASQLNISEQTVKNTLTTALKRLRQRLGNYTNIFFIFL